MGMSDERYDLSEAEIRNPFFTPPEPEPVCAFCLGDVQSPQAIKEYYGKRLMNFCGQGCEDAWVDRATNYYAENT